MELVSVIVPVYKVEKYLAECLDSILASTYTNLEVIVVDDGSPDRCPEICDEYAAKDPRVKVIHQENQGLVGARNKGLEHASGAYIGFVDSDDAISPIMYEQLVRAIETTNADIAACEYRTSTNTLFAGEDIANDIQLEGFDAQLSVLTNAPSVRSITWTSCYVWNKLYHREKIWVYFQKECLMCEDLRFNWDYITRSRKMVIVPVGLYLYRLHESSITGAYKKHSDNPRTVMQGISNAQLWMKIATEYHKENNNALSNYLAARSAYVAHGALWRVFRFGKEKENSNFVLDAVETIHTNFKLLFHDTTTYDLWLRLMIGLCRYSFPFWKFAARCSSVLIRK